MKAGVVFPQTEIGADPIAIRDYVQAAENLGFSHLIVYDHVLGADTTKHPNWTGGYTLESMFHEPFVLFGYLSAITTNIELVTAVLILGQRQTALAAKQAAQCDVLSNGRLRLGVGVGWNPVEYEALGENFHTRGARQTEQIQVMRQLWTNPVIDFHGKYHHITNAGINPLPIQRPIPIWIGAGSRANPTPPDPALRRIARLADGWFPQVSPEAAPPVLERLANLAQAAGRNPAHIPMEPRINSADGNPEFWQAQTQTWTNLGATHISINTMRAGYQSPQDHINAIRQFREVLN